MESVKDIEMIGKIYKTNSCGDLIIRGVHSRHKTKSRSQKVYICEFIKTKYITLAEKHTITSGMVRDIYCGKVYGIGFAGMDKPSKEKHYKRWISMMDRCYSGRFPSYEDTKVCDRWLNFNNFNSDFDKIKGYTEVLDRGIKYELDKDIFNRSEFSIYSLENCCVVPKSINLFFIRGLKSIKNNITYNEKYNNYTCKCRVKSKTINVGTFKDYDIGIDTIYKNRKDELKRMLLCYSWLNTEISDRCFEKLEESYYYAKNNRI